MFIAGSNLILYGENILSKNHLFNKKRRDKLFTDNRLFYMIFLNTLLDLIVARPTHLGHLALTSGKEAKTRSPANGSQRSIVAARQLNTSYARLCRDPYHIRVRKLPHHLEKRKS